MRLIDADALKEYLMEEYECDACHDDGDDWSAGRASAWWAAQVHVNDAPTIDAIPMEWLEHMMTATTLARTSNAIKDVLAIWKRMGQKEQEAQDGK